MKNIIGKGGRCVIINNRDGTVTKDPLYSNYLKDYISLDVILASTIQSLSEILWN